MDDKSDEQFIIMKAAIGFNRQESNEKIKNLKEDLKAIIK